MTFRTMLLAAAAAATFAGAAHAATITTLYNTGVDASGTPAANGSLDIHYTLDGVADAKVANQSNGYPNNVWIGNDAVSSWIGPNNQELDGYFQVYDYKTTFSLNGYNAATASITGRWSVDDVGIKILLNGVDTGNGYANWNEWTNFAINSGFQAGTNTLEFQVYNTNDYGPTGLRVEMTGTAQAVPEPAAWALMLVGFGGLGAMLRRRRGVLAAIA